MTTEPQIKKYRHRVSDERIEQGAIAIVQVVINIIAPDREKLARQFKTTLKSHDKQFNDLCEREKSLYRKYAKAALEADAEVIEAELQTTYQGKPMNVCYFKTPDGDFIAHEDNFNAEWEEVK